MWELNKTEHPPWTRIIYLNLLEGTKKSPANQCCCFSLLRGPDVSNQVCQSLQRSSMKLLEPGLNGIPPVLIEAVSVQIQGEHLHEKVNTVLRICWQSSNSKNDNALLYTVLHLNYHFVYRQCNSNVSSSI